MRMKIEKRREKRSGKRKESNRRMGGNDMEK